MPICKASAACEPAPAGTIAGGPSWTPKFPARFSRQGTSARHLAKRSGGHISEQTQNRPALMRLSHRYRIHPNRRQRDALDEMLYWFSARKDSRSFISRRDRLIRPCASRASAARAIRRSRRKRRLASPSVSPDTA